MRDLLANWDFNGKVVKVSDELTRSFALGIHPLEVQMVTGELVSMPEFIEVLKTFYESALNQLHCQFEKTQAGEDISYEDFLIEIEVGSITSPVLLVKFSYVTVKIPFGANFKDAYISFFVGMRRYIKDNNLSKEAYEIHDTGIKEFLATGTPDTEEESELLEYLQKLDDIYDATMPLDCDFGNILEHFEKLGYFPTFESSLHGKLEYSISEQINHLLYRVSNF